MRKVIFDVDTGSDDAVELIYAVNSQQFDIKGITTVFGSKKIEEVSENTLKTLELCETNIPVYQGCHRPLVRGLYDSDVILQSKNTSDDKKVGFHEVFNDLTTTKTIEEKNAVTFLIETLKKEKCTIVASAALTNIACAFLLCPEIKENIEEIVIMGGGINMSNKTMNAEGNFYRDPEAAKIVLTSGCNITLIPLDATHDIPLGCDEVYKLKEIGNKKATFIAKVLEMRIKSYNLLQPLDEKDQGIIHDLLCTFYLLDKDVISEYVHYNLDVSIDHGSSAGKLLVDYRYEHESTNITTAIKVNKELYHKMLFELI